jgi:hypothetical protein
VFRLCAAQPFDLPFDVVWMACFAAGLAVLIISLGFFIRDSGGSLAALRLETERFLTGWTAEQSTEPRPASDY